MKDLEKPIENLEENLKKFVKNLDELVNKVVGGYELYEPIYGNFECEIENNKVSCNIPDYVDIKRREDIIKAVLNVCNYIVASYRKCTVRVSNYSKTSEIIERKSEFTHDEMDRVRIAKYYKPYSIYIGDLRTIKGLIQISVYIS